MSLRSCWSSRRAGFLLLIAIALSVPRTSAAFTLVQTLHDDADGLGGAWAAASGFMERHYSRSAPDRASVCIPP